MAIVEFTKDCYPYCKGDKLEMSEEEMKDADALGEQRGVGKPYKVVVRCQAGRADRGSQGCRGRPERRPRRPDLVPQTAAEANLQAPGVEAELAAEDERQAEVADKKSIQKKSK